MSFFGKKYQKVDIENILEFMSALNLPEKIRSLLRRTEALVSFQKNNDGSIQYVVEDKGEILLNQKIVLGTENDFTTPDGQMTKHIFNLEGDTLKATMSFPDGKKVYFERKFEGDKMKMTVKADVTDIVGVVHYQAV